MANDAMPGTLQGHAERGILLRMSLVENVRESYSPSGIDVGIDFGQPQVHVAEDAGTSAPGRFRYSRC